MRKFDSVLVLVILGLTAGLLVWALISSSLWGHISSDVEAMQVELANHRATVKLVHDSLQAQQEILLAHEKIVRDELQTSRKEYLHDHDQTHANQALIMKRQTEIMKSISAIAARQDEIEKILKVKVKQEEEVSLPRRLLHAKPH
jgi:hypothetical protein